MAQAPGGPRSDKGVYILDQLEKPPGWLQGLYWVMCVAWFLGGIGFLVAAFSPSEDGFWRMFYTGLAIIHAVMAVMLAMRREQFMQYAKIVCWACLILVGLRLPAVIGLMIFFGPAGVLILIGWTVMMAWYYGQIRVIDAMENYGMF